MVRGPEDLEDQGPSQGRWMGSGRPPRGYEDDGDLWDDQIDGGSGSRRREPLPPIDEEVQTSREGDAEWRSGSLVPKGTDPRRARVLRNLNTIVGKHFDVYDFEYDRKSAVYYYRPPADVEEPFEALRRDLRGEGFIPFLRDNRGESAVQIFRRPEGKTASPVVNLVLLFATIFTTIWAGTLLWAARTGLKLEYGMEIFEYLGRPELVGNGALYFALPLMLILGIHEMGHFFMARRHGVDASLPFFIPMPPPFFIGTMGAFISMREPIPSKKALMNIGAAGPIAGFLVAIPVTMAGMWLTINQPVSLDYRTGEFIVFNTPIIYDAMATLFPSARDLAIHPTAIAGWVGIFITAINLLPAGQLDGGHVARALLGEKAYIASAMTIGVLVAAGLITNFMMWFIFGLFILFLTGVRHPPPLNDISGLGRKHIAVGIATIAIFAVSIHPIPLDTITIDEPDINFALDTPETDKSVAPGDTGGTMYIVTLDNIGKEDDTFTIGLDPPESGEGTDDENATGFGPGWGATLEVFARLPQVDGEEGEGTPQEDGAEADGNDTAPEDGPGDETEALTRPEGNPDLALQYPVRGGEENISAKVELAPGSSVLLVLTVTPPAAALLGDAGVIELSAVSDTLEKYHPLDEGDDAVVSLTFTTTVSPMEVTPDDVSRSLNRVQEGGRNLAQFYIQVLNLMDAPDMLNITVSGLGGNSGWNMSLSTAGGVIWTPGAGTVMMGIGALSPLNLTMDVWIGEEWITGPQPLPLSLELTFMSIPTGAEETFRAVVYPDDD